MTDRTTALNKLHASTQSYQEQAKFSRVAVLVHEAVGLVLLRKNTTTDDYVLGYIDGILNTIERFGAPGEVHALCAVLYAAKALARNTPVQDCGLELALAELERLAA